MRTLLRIAMDGSTILALALFSAALHGALRSLRPRRATVGLEGLSNPEVRIRARRLAFLSRANLL